jgi:hypothetical protein
MSARLETHLKGCHMSVGATVLTGVIAALAGGVGVVAGAFVTNRAQDRQWLRDQQLAAYRDLLGHYAQFSMEINLAHQGRRDWDYDWGSWSTALVSASLVAPDHVAMSINDFGDAVQVLLDASAARNPIEDPLTLDEIRCALTPAGQAQVTLVNAIRDSLGMHEPLTAPIGGTPVRTLHGGCREATRQGRQRRASSHRGGFCAASFRLCSVRR